MVVSLSSIMMIYFIINAKNKSKSLWISVPVSITNKKATINPINKKDDKRFQYAITVALNHEEIKKDLQRITKIKPFINKYN